MKKLFMAAVFCFGATAVSAENIFLEEAELPRMRDDTYIFINTLTEEVCTMSNYKLSCTPFHILSEQAQTNVRATLQQEGHNWQPSEPATIGDKAANGVESAKEWLKKKTSGN